MLEVDDKLKSTIVHNFNVKRNLIAAGGHIKHESACRMATMEWDDELAAMAAFNVMKCDGHDECRNTEAFIYSGQNIAGMSFYGQPNATYHMERAINMWYEEVRYSSMKHIRSSGLPGYKGLYV